MSEKKPKYLRPRWAAFITIVTPMVTATSIYLADGNYPVPYVVWNVIMISCTMMLPWVFVNWNEMEY